MKSHEFHLHMRWPFLTVARLACAVFLVLVVLNSSGHRAWAESPGDWQLALPGWTYRFPDDHRAHPDFKTEWWYFTGNVKADNGRAFGYELTFFRQGVISPGQRTPPPGPGQDRSHFVQNDFKFAHLAITDLADGRFHYTQRLSRGAFGEAGFGPLVNADGPGANKPFVWLENWTLTAEADGSWRIHAKTNDLIPMSIDFRLEPRKGPVIEGTDGVSQKADGVGNASHYYSFTRLATVGNLTVGEGTSPQSVHGESWFDHEWASNQLGPDQIGWNWFCIQFDDQTELMLYSMRRRDGSTDPFSSGTYVDVNGNSRHLQHADFRLQPSKTWHSAKTGATYPVAWQLAVPTLGIEARVQARLDDQELALPQISYWEGATEIIGTRAGSPVSGHGYMELTGYTGQLPGLQQRQSNTETGLLTAPR